MSDPIQVVNAAAQVIQDKDGPWYTRTEFWTTLATIGLGLIGQKSANPVVQNISATLGGLSPIVYAWGRSSVKATQAAGVMSAVAQVLHP